MARDVVVCFTLIPCLIFLSLPAVSCAELFQGELPPAQKPSYLLAKLDSSTLSSEPVFVSPKAEFETFVQKISPLAATKISVRGGALFQHRKNYRLIQPQNEREPVAAQRTGEPFEYDVDGLGSIGAVSIEKPLGDRFSLGASFQGAALENSQSRLIPGGTGSGVGSLIENASVIPLLTEFGKETGLGSAVEVGGDPNNVQAKAETNFRYDTQQYDTSIDLIWNNLLGQAEGSWDGLIGFGYLRINQNFDLHTRGINVNNVGVTQTNTSESLRENLFGGRTGLRARVPLNPQFTVFGSAVGGFYANGIRYEGMQEFSNASFVGFGGAQDFLLRTSLRENRFVPRLEIFAGLEYRITSGLSLAAQYGFDALWEAGMIDHPQAVFNNTDRDVIDHPVRIGSETLPRHFIELKLRLEF